jgi:plastocyanin
MALCAAAWLAAGPSTAADGAAAKAATTVKVVDDRYSPKRLTLAKGTRVKWVWSSRAAHRHDVYLDVRPSGAERFRSPPATAPFDFARKLRKPGVYKVLCTFHERMRMRIEVTR